MNTYGNHVAPGINNASFSQTADFPVHVSSQGISYNPHMYCYPTNVASHGSVPLQSAVPKLTVPSQPLPYAHVYQDPQFSSLAIMSNHLLEQQIMTRGIEPFDGTAHKFWPWVSKIQDYARGLNLSYRKTLQLWETYTKGGPQKVISHALSSTGEVTKADFDTVWIKLTQRFGSSQLIAAELRNLIEEFPQIKSRDQGDQLLNLVDLCEIIKFNKRDGRCPELVCSFCLI